MAKTNSKILAVALCISAAGGFFLAPSASAASDLGGKFMVKSTNAQESQFWGLRGWNAPGKSSGGPGGGSTGGATTPDPGAGTGGSGDTPGVGGGTGGDGSNPGGLPSTETPGSTNPSIAAGYWSGMTYGSGRYLAVSYQGNQTLSSTDEGKSWSSDELPSGTWTGVAYGAGKFVAVSQSENYDPTTGGNVATSTDGKSWSSKRTPGYSYQGVAYGNGIFVAVGDSPRGAAILSSTDGVNWTERALPADFTADGRAGGIMGLARVQFLNGQFYAATGLGMDTQDGRMTRSAALFRSSDGKSWSSTDALPGTISGWNDSSHSSYSRDKIVSTSSGLIQSAIKLGQEEADFFRSTDGGKSWSKFSPTGLPISVAPQFSMGSTAFAYAPLDEGGIELYSSTDGGSSWKKVPNGVFPDGFAIKNDLASAGNGNCMVILPADSSTAFRYCG